MVEVKEYLHNLKCRGRGVNEFGTDALWPTRVGWTFTSHSGLYYSQNMGQRRVHFLRQWLTLKQGFVK
jgi:hypothetical protein